MDLMNVGIPATAAVHMREGCNHYFFSLPTSEFSDEPQPALAMVAFRGRDRHTELLNTLRRVSAERVLMGFEDDPGALFEALALPPGVSMGLYARETSGAFVLLAEHAVEDAPPAEEAPEPENPPAAPDEEESEG